ncbi:MAG: GntR family transcriptional regulator [Phycisphaeraceae bacterium]
MTSTAVYRKLKQWIYHGQLQPGERLVEVDLASRVGISRIPLRESLRRLESEGLVRSIPNRATFVQPLTADDLREIFLMRLLLEPPAARLAAQHGTRRTFDYLRRLALRMGEAAQQDNLRTLYRLDYRFHHAIVRASRCQRLQRAYECCHIQIVGPRINYRNLRWETGELTQQLHADLVDMLEAGQAGEAEAHLRRTLQQSMDALNDYLAHTSGFDDGDQRP